MEQTRQEKELTEFYNKAYSARLNTMTGTEGARNLVAYTALKDYLGGLFTLLDFGCGQAHTIHFLRSMYPDGKYTGVDLSEVVLKLARYTLPDVEFYTRIPDGAYYDIILCMGVAEHAEDPAEMLAMLGDRLNEGGVMYVETPNCLEYSDEKGEGFRRPSSTSIQEEWHWERSTWEKAIDDAGLEIVEGLRGPLPQYEFCWLLEKR